MHIPRSRLAFAAAALLAAGGSLVPLEGAEREGYPRDEGPKPSASKIGTSKYMPHIGAKQRAKAARRTALSRATEGDADAK